MKVPKIKWKKFTPGDPEILDLCPFTKYLVLIEEGDYDNYPFGVYDEHHSYSVDVATPFGSYLDNFWDTEYDWDEGQGLKVLAYAELPEDIKLYELEEQK